LVNKFVSTKKIIKNVSEKKDVLFVIVLISELQHIILQKLTENTVNGEQIFSNYFISVQGSIL